LTGKLPVSKAIGRLVPPIFGFGVRPGDARGDRPRHAARWGRPRPGKKYLRARPARNDDLAEAASSFEKAEDVLKTKTH